MRLPPIFFACCTRRRWAAMAYGIAARTILEERQNLGRGSRRPPGCKIESPIPLSLRREKARCSTATRSHKVWQEIGDFDRHEPIFTHGFRARSDPREFH